MSLGRAVRALSGGKRPRRSSPDALANEREFLRQSIGDLEEQRASGEVDEEDFAVLDSRYRRRLTEVEAAIADLTASDMATPGMAIPDMGAARQAATDNGPRVLRRRLASRRARLVIGIAAAACFVVAATLLAASLAGVRLPGESASGSVSLSSAQQEQETLDRAAILGSEGQAAEAVQLYNQVLQADPNQPDALTYGGWLVRLAGLSSKNRLVLARGRLGRPGGQGRARLSRRSRTPRRDPLRGLRQTACRLGPVSRRAQQRCLQDPSPVGRRDRGESLRSCRQALAASLRRGVEEHRSRRLTWGSPLCARGPERT